MDHIDIVDLMEIAAPLLADLLDHEDLSTIEGVEEGAEGIARTAIPEVGELTLFDAD